MRIVVLLALAGCMSSEPVRDGSASIDLDTPGGVTATYRVIGGSNDSECAHGEHFTPLNRADVRFGPSGGELVALAESANGRYVGTATTVYAPAYQFSVDGEVFELAAPPYYSASVKPMSVTQALVEVSDVSASSDVMIHMPDGNTTSRTISGSPAVVEADFSRRGEYRIEIVRNLESEAGTVELRRAATLTMP